MDTEYRNNLLLKVKAYSSRALFVVAFIAAWEIVARLKLVNPLLFPPPSVVYSALIDWAQSGELLRDIKASLWRMAAGFGIGGAVGVSLGMLTARTRFLNLSLNPIIQLLRPLPPVAIIPLVIVWLGIGNIAKIFSIAFAVFFPVWINTYLGASSIAEVYIWSGRILSRSKLRRVFKIVLPATLPNIVAGLRTAISIAFIMVYVAEIAGASAGIGYQISVSHLAYRIDKMMAALVVLGAAGALADSLFAITVSILFPWAKEKNKK